MEHLSVQGYRSEGLSLPPAGSSLPTGRRGAREPGRGRSPDSRLTRKEEFVRVLGFRGCIQRARKALWKQSAL